MRTSIVWWLTPPFEFRLLFCDDVTRSLFEEARGHFKMCAPGAGTGEEVTCAARTVTHCVDADTVLLFGRVEEHVRPKKLRFSVVEIGVP
jgi:hypothetical protein